MAAGRKSHCQSGRLGPHLIFTPDPAHLGPISKEALAGNVGAWELRGD